jgi:hypothetical protein
MDGHNNVVVVQWVPLDGVLPGATIVLDGIEVVSDDIQLVELKCW